MEEQNSEKKGTAYIPAHIAIQSNPPLHYYLLLFMLHGFVLPFVSQDVFIDY